MSSSGLDDEVATVLGAAGWRPGRCVPISDYLACWDARGIPPNEPATVWCAEFGGLTLHHPPRLTIGDVEHSDFTMFDPVYATDGIDDEVLSEYSRLAGERLCPVGVNRSHMTVMVAASGRVVAGVDNYLFEIGWGRTAALTAICRGAPPRKVGEWRPQASRRGLRTSPPSHQS